MVKLHIILEKDEDGGFAISCPGLPGCISQGETEEEAIDNFREAFKGWIEAHDQLAAEQSGRTTKELAFSL